MAAGGEGDLSLLTIDMSEIPVLALEVVIKTMLCQLLCFGKGWAVSKYKNLDEVARLTKLHATWVGQDKLGLASPR